jgi:hypothetical protein
MASTVQSRIERRLKGVLLLMAVLGAGCTVGEPAEEKGKFGQRVAAATIADTIEVYNLVGNVRVAPGGGVETVVDAIFLGEKSDELALHSRSSSGAVIVSVQYPAGRLLAGGSTVPLELLTDDSGVFPSDRGRKISFTSDAGHETSADLSIVLREGAMVAISLARGTVQIEGMSLAITSLQQPVRLYNRDGRVEVIE